jgi:uncharacterized cofD-like protein
MVRGQVEVATTPGDVLHISLDPPEPPACKEAVAAIRDADAIVLGPGSWYTSVIPHLVIPELARAITDSPARRIVVLNLNPQVGETTGFAAHTYLDVLYNYLPDLRIDTVIADRHHVEDLAALRTSAADLGAEVFLMDVARSGPGNAGMHDPQRLAVAFDTVLA